MTQIAVLLHKNEKNIEGLFIHHLAKHWSEKGIYVKYYYGTDQIIKADILIPQIDLTIDPKDYVQLIDDFDGVVLNKSIHDISKSAISKNALSADSDYSGRVIVKSNLNCDGYPELKLKTRWRRGIFVVRKRLGLYHKSYLIFPGLRSTPSKYLTSKDFIVEKYLPEMIDGQYIVRVTSFLGDKSYSIELRSKDPIIKGGNTMSRKIVEPPQEVFEIKNRLKFDYGKFDYVIIDGKVVLFDANKTPGSPHPNAIPNIIRRVSPGIDYYIKML